MRNSTITADHSDRILPRVLLGVTSDVSLAFWRGYTPAIRASGLEPVFVASPGPVAVRFRETDAVEVIPVPMKRDLSLLADMRSLALLVSVLRRVRPVLTNFGTPKAGFLGSIAAWFTRVPCRIYTLPGLRLETTKGWKRWLLLGAERVACGCSHRVICVGPSLRKRAIELNIVTPHKAVLAGSGYCGGVEVERFQATPDNLARAEEARVALHIPSRVPVVGFVGRFTRDKGIVELMEAYEQIRKDVPELRLLLVGDFESGDPVPPEVQTRIVNDSNIFCPGFVQDAAPYYHLMDVVALPSYREGFPRVPVEASAAGKPVVTTTATGAIDSVRDQETGIIVPFGDANALAAAIKRLLEDANLRQSMGSCGCEWVKNEFSAEKARAALVEEHRRVLENYFGSSAG